jgi:predicted nucleotidyltransferase component of viral defense system
VNIARLPRIKIDITLDEPLILKPQIKEIYHPYSDMLKEGKRILAYTYEELFAEKLRALVQRLRPRDLYDVASLYHHKPANINPAAIRETLTKKCAIRSVPYPEIARIETHNNRRLLESEWSTQLRHQMSELKSFELYIKKLKEVFDWIDHDSITGRS